MHFLFETMHILHSTLGLNSNKTLTDVWFQYVLRNYKSPRFIITTFGVLLTSYIFFPSSLLAVSHKPSKRPDKYTCGFKNSGNDCFANSTLQSLSSLDTLYLYLAEMLSFQMPPGYTIYPLPLHTSLYHMLTLLREPIYFKKTLDVWEVLRILETIHRGKIGRNQHDAHELYVFIIQTLEDEYDRYFQDLKRSQLTSSIPTFPFFGVVTSSLRCIDCGGRGNLVKYPMLMVELNVGNQNDLNKMWRGSWNDIIVDYSCLGCVVKRIILNRDRLNLNGQQEKCYQLLKEKLTSGSLSINDDLIEDPVYTSIITSYPFLKSSSKVVKEIKYSKKPYIIPIHLSRSVYLDSQMWRNGASIIYPEAIEVEHVKYTLKSMIRHQGSHSAGHYECYRHKPAFCKVNGEYRTGKFKGSKKLSSASNKPYWRISDSHVSECTSDSVLNDGKAAYILVYEQEVDNTL